jgi:hypothetical protein
MFSGIRLAVRSVRVLDIDPGVVPAVRTNVKLISATVILGLVPTFSIPARSITSPSLR